jgi:hypothetical protein
LIYNVIMTTMTTIMLGLGGWMAQTIVLHGNTLASQGTQIKINTERIDRVENIGSPQLNSHVQEDNSRIAAHQARLEKLEAAVLTLQATPGELKAISVELRGLKEGQLRIEKALEMHTEKGTK